MAEDSTVIGGSGIGGLLSYRLGVVGVIFNLLLLFVAIGRTYLHFSPYHPPWYSTRKITHLLIVLYFLLQCISFSSFVEGADSYYKSTYACHLLGVFCEICAYSMMSFLWAKTLISREEGVRIITILIAIVLVFFFYILSLIVEMCLSPLDFANWARSSRIYDFTLLVEPLVLFINGCFIVYIGNRILNNLRKSSSWKSIVPSQKRNILVRLVGTNLVCSLCFTCRAIIELYLFFQVSTTKYDNYDSNRNTSSFSCQWAIISWAPTSVAACMLLYTLRRSQSRKSSGTGSAGHASPYEKKLRKMKKKFGGKSSSFGHFRSNSIIDGSNQRVSEVSTGSSGDMELFQGLSTNSRLFNEGFSHGELQDANGRGLMFNMNSGFLGIGDMDASELDMALAEVGITSEEGTITHAIMGHSPQQEYYDSELVLDVISTPILSLSEKMEYLQQSSSYRYTAPSLSQVGGHGGRPSNGGGKPMQQTGRLTAVTDVGSRGSSFSSVGNGGHSLNQMPVNPKQSSTGSDNTARANEYSLYKPPSESAVFNQASSSPYRFSSLTNSSFPRAESFDSNSTNGNGHLPPSDNNGVERQINAYDSPEPKTASKSKLSRKENISTEYTTFSSSFSPVSSPTQFNT